jgi:hypothetical protein
MNRLRCNATAASAIMQHNVSNQRRNILSSNRRDFLKGSVAVAALGWLSSIAEQGAAAESPEKQIVLQWRGPVRHNLDVFVAGGGRRAWRRR